MNQISSNVWAFGVFLLAAIAAIVGAAWANHDLLIFAGALATSASAIFQGGSKPGA